MTRIETDCRAVETIHLDCLMPASVIWRRQRSSSNPWRLSKWFVFLIFWNVSSLFSNICLVRCLKVSSLNAFVWNCRSTTFHVLWHLSCLLVQGTFVLLNLTAEWSWIRAILNQTFCGFYAEKSLVIRTSHVYDSRSSCVCFQDRPAFVLFFVLLFLWCEGVLVVFCSSGWITE